MDLSDGNDDQQVALTLALENYNLFGLWPAKAISCSCR